MDKPTQNSGIDEVVTRLRAKLGAEWNQPGSGIQRKNDSKAGSRLSSGQTTAVETGDTMGASFERLASTIAEAEAHQYVWTTEPVVDHYRGFVKRLAHTVGKTFLYFAQVVTKPQQAFNTALIRSVHRMTESIQAMEETLRQLQSREDKSSVFESEIAGMKGRIAEIGHQLEAVSTAAERRLDNLQTRLEALPILEKHFSFLESRLDILSRMEQTVVDAKAQVESIPKLERSLSELTAKINLLSGMEKRLEGLNRAQDIVSELRPQVVHVEEHLARLMSIMVGHERRLAVVLDEARRRLPQEYDREQLEVLSRELDVMDEELYLAFENKYRGSREEIKGRVKEYVPTIRKAGAGSRQQPVLDLGCGRGEWLEVLKDEGLVGFGLDSSSTMVGQCRALGFSVEQGDALEYIKQIQDESLGAVTAFHLIEHLPFKTWISLYDEALRVLKHGGVIIFETPNPANVLVASSAFYLDPSHRRPLPAELVKFIAEERGFCNVEIVGLHPMEKESFINENSEVANRFNNYFYGPRDYAVIAWKG